MTKLLDRAAILNAQDIRTEDVPVPEWGGIVRVRSLTGTELFNALKTDGDGAPKRHTERLLVHCIVGEDGQPCFRESDIDQLAKKSAVALERVAAAAGRLNFLSQASVDAAEKNS